MKTNDIYKRIFLTSSLSILVLVQLYATFLSNGIDWFNFSNVENAFTRMFLQFLINVVGFGMINILVYSVVYKIEKLMWKESNKKIWIDGVWIHIHDKEKPRIGVVTIKQSFLDIKVKAINTYPIECKISDGKSNTEWWYITNEFFHNEKSDSQLFACYRAHAKGGSVDNLGIHTLNIETDEYHGYADYMHGTFTDAFKLDEGSVTDVSDKTGILYMYKIADRQLAKILKNSKRYNVDKLSELTSILESCPIVDKKTKNNILRFKSEMQAILKKRGYL